MMRPEQTAVRVRVTGWVQGVSFRAWVRDEAERLRLTGWVRNERDGSVTALIAGPEAQVARLVAAMRRGPRAAAVEALTTEPVDLPVPPSGFRITG